MSGSGLTPGRWFLVLVLACAFGVPSCGEDEPLGLARSSGRSIGEIQPTGDPTVIATVALYDVIVKPWY